MNTLTKPMIDAMKTIYKVSSTDEINKKTLLALTNKNILIGNILSKEAKQFLISKMTLKEQCKALVLNKLEEYNIFQSREDACVRFLSAQLETNKNYHKEMFIKNLNDIFNYLHLKL